jgi:Ca2+-binding EF-hand superfamily protein
MVAIPFIDGDGKLSPEELTAVMRSLDQNPTEKQLQAIMEGMDTDHDGTVDFEEFLTLMSAHSELNTDDEIRSAFETFDRDKNGTINIEELRSMMNKLRVPVTDEELSVMMKEADEDGNGVIDFQGASVYPPNRLSLLLIPPAEFRRVSHSYLYKSNKLMDRPQILSC